MIDEFVEATLVRGLERRGASAAQVEEATADVRSRLVALAARWCDRDEIAPLLAPFLDVALWNEPKDVHPFVRALVTVGIRNSALEDLHNAQDVIAENDWRPLTIEAAHHFADWAFDLGVGAAVPAPDDDPFGGLRERHPVSWAAFSVYDRPPAGGTRDYAAPQSEPWPALIAEFEAQVTEKNENVVHAMEERIDRRLAEAVNRLCQGEIDALLFPSFKHISRNPRRLFRITETVLTNGGTIVTSNSMVTPDRVRWRDELVYYNVYPDSWWDEHRGVGRNEPCPCGSGLKFKRCHGT